MKKEERKVYQEYLKDLKEESDKAHKYNPAFSKLQRSAILGTGLRLSKVEAEILYHGIFTLLHCFTENNKRELTHD